MSEIEGLRANLVEEQQRTKMATLRANQSAAELVSAQAERDDVREELVDVAKAWDADKAAHARLIASADAQHVAMEAERDKVAAALEQVRLNLDRREMLINELDVRLGAMTSERDRAVEQVAAGAAQLVDVKAVWGSTAKALVVAEESEGKWHRWFAAASVAAVVLGLVAVVLAVALKGAM